MRTTGTLVLLLVLTWLVTPVRDAAGTAPARAAAAPDHSVSVTGDGVETYPAFDETIQRYGVSVTEETRGTLTVHATTSDPAGTVSVNGRPAPAGTRTVTGLEAGDEVSIFIEDAAGTTRYAFVYLPVGFPALERVTSDPAPTELAPGLVMLTLAQWVQPSPTFETAVDVNGVPAFVTAVRERSMDLKRQPEGTFTVSRHTTVPGRTGQDLVLLDDQLQPIATRSTVGLADTDGHDSILLQDGTVWLMAYEPNQSTGLVDSVIQEIRPDGTLGFEWTSAPHADETMLPDDPDYAHINSFQIMADGHLLASFRHLSSVFKIATHARDGFTPGAVIWKLGGRDSDFTFPPGDGGPCAQHTAHELDNGNIVMFDNGSWDAFGSENPLCVDPGEPDGPAVQRTQTRVVELALDESTGEATVAKAYAPAGRFAIFAGSSQPLDNGNTLIGWAAETKALASEIDAAGNLLWEIRDPRASGRYFTYRAHKAEVPDTIRPQVSVSVPDGGTYVEGTDVPFPYECSDSGGSSLHTCTGTAVSLRGLDTSTPGDHRVTVTATDGAGNRTTVTRTYRVLAKTRPDAMIRTSGNPKFTGDDRYGSPRSQRARALVKPGSASTAVVRLQNDGARSTRLKFDVRGTSTSFRVMGRHADGGRTPRLQPGESWTFRLRAVPRGTAAPGDQLVLKFPVRSIIKPVREDAVSLLLRAAR